MISEAQPATTQPVRHPPGFTNPLLWAALAAVMASAGCSEPTAVVEGAVRFDGEALNVGAIQFLPGDGDYRKAASAPVLAGRYRIPRLKPGEHVVSVRGVRNESRGPEPRPLPDNLEGNDAIVVLGSGSNTIDISLKTP